MIKTILFATDLGVYTPYLLQHVAALAKQHQASIIVVHAVEPLSSMASAVVHTYMPSETKEELEQNGIQRIIANIRQRIIDDWEDEYMQGNDGLGHIRNVRVLEGKPVDIVLQQAQVHCADLIVLGSRSQTTSESPLLGSVTAKILQLAETPVYMVPLARGTSAASSRFSGWTP